MSIDLLLTIVAWVVVTGLFAFLALELLTSFFLLFSSPTFLMTFSVVLALALLTKPALMALMALIALLALLSLACFFRRLRLLPWPAVVPTLSSIGGINVWIVLQALFVFLMALEFSPEYPDKSLASLAYGPGAVVDRTVSSVYEDVVGERTEKAGDERDEKWNPKVIVVGRPCVLVAKNGQPGSPHKVASWVDRRSCLPSEGSHDNKVQPEESEYKEATAFQVGAILVSNCEDQERHEEVGDEF